MPTLIEALILSERLRMHHNRFYLEDGNVVIMVEDVLFKVHRYFLKQASPVFSDMFSFKSYEGQSDGRPIHLEGTTAFEFEAFLSCLYPRQLWKTDDMSFETWVTVLNSSVKWQADTIRDLAVDHLMDIRTDAPTLAQQIALASRNKIEDWYWQACLKMCERGPPLTEKEAEQLGIRETVRISSIRQRVRACAARERTAWHQRDCAVLIPEVDHDDIKKELVMYASGQMTHGGESTKDTPLHKPKRGT